MSAFVCVCARAPAALSQIVSHLHTDKEVGRALFLHVELFAG